MTAVNGVDKVGYQQIQGEGLGAHLIIRAWLQEASVAPAGSSFYGWCNVHILATLVE